MTDYTYNLPRYRVSPVLGLRDCSALLALQAVLMFTSQFCFERLKLPSGALSDVITAALEMGTLFLPVAFLLSVRGISWRTVLGRPLDRGAGVCSLLLAAVGLLPILAMTFLWLYLVSLLGGSLGSLSGHELSGAPLLIQIVLIAGSAAISEEVMFRGVLMPSLERRVGRNWAMVLTSLAFAMFHGSVVRIPVIFIISLILCQLTLRSGSLAASMIYHFVHDALSLVLVYVLQGAAAGVAEAAPDPSLVFGNSQLMSVGVWLCLFVLAAGGLFMFICYRAFAHRCPRTVPELRRETGEVGISTWIGFALALVFLFLRMSLTGV